MADREKVIKHFEHLLNAAKANYQDFVDLTVDVGEEILAMLKEQEAVEPYITGSGESFETAETWWYACGNCNKALDVKDNYCRHCGKPIDWEGR